MRVIRRPRLVFFFLLYPLGACVVLLIVISIYRSLPYRPIESPVRQYLVQEGETLETIAQRFRVSPALVAALNPMEDHSLLYENQVLLIPEQGFRLSADFDPIAARCQWNPQLPGRRWRYIVIHHSATAQGSARELDQFHRHKRQWEHGLGYDFVIGNGLGSPDGAIEVGHRWHLQMVGAHARSPNDYYNRCAIGICLVGNFEVSRPTQKQMESLAGLARYLCRRYRIPKRRVIGHRDVIKAHTVCPGKYFPVDELKDRL